MDIDFVVGSTLKKYLEVEVIDEDMRKEEVEMLKKEVFIVVVDFYNK